MTAAERRADGYGRLRRRAFAARGLIIAYMVLLALLLLLGGITLGQELKLHYSMSDAVLVPLFLFGNATLALTAVAVMMWVHRAHKYMRESGLRDLSYSPAWSVVSFFVPLANLVVPFRAMRELWNRSHGEDQYQAAGSVPDVGAWWSCFLAGSAIELVLMTLHLITDLTPLVIFTPPGVDTGFVLFAIVLLMGAGFFLFRIIGKITRAQSSFADFGAIFA